MQQLNTLPESGSTNYQYTSLIMRERLLRRLAALKEVTMSDGKFRSPIGSQVVVFIVTLLAVTVSLAACSEKPQSLADYIAKICAAPFRTATAEEAPYLAENVSAMSKMMIDMGIRPSGDVDSDFVSMMTPHHQGAIEMAQAELRYGHNEQLRRMAQEIIVTQQQEIAAMRLALGQPLPPSVS
jgi:Domain of unknown function (DUF305)